MSDLVSLKDAASESITNNDLDDISISSVKPLISGDGNSVTKSVSGNVSDVVVDSSSVNGQNEENIEDPILAKYRVACQSNDLATVRSLIESGSVDINHDYDEEEEITGLHWASVNNRLAIAQYLVSKGADVNRKAGKLHATPLHWAASYGYVHIVDFFMKNGADATIVDDQGFNLLHLSINSSNIMLILYVLFFVVDKGILEVDCRDPNDRTALLWAAYQGDSLSVKALLKFGASTKIADNTGFTPLHWGIVKGQPHVLKYLIKDGADFFAKTNDGKDCFTIAQEMGTKYSLKDSLDHCGFDQDGYPKRRLFKKSFHAKVVTFFLPWILLGLIISFFSHVHPLFALIITLILLLATNKLLNNFIVPCYTNRSNNKIALIETPLFAGVFTSSVFWLTLTWLCNVFYNTFTEKPLQNIILLVDIVLLSKFFISLFYSDPGNMYEENDHDSVRNSIDELIKLGKFDTHNFCIETLKRKPLRSRYSYINKALVTRFDHYCPWIYNDVGLTNHKHFMFFILLMEVGISLFVSLCFEYFDMIEDLYDDDKLQCLFLGDDELCAGLTYSRFTFLIMAWSLFQALWVGFLLFVQVFQIFKGVTSYEFNKLVKHGNQVSQSSSLTQSFNTTPDLPQNDTSSLEQTDNETTSAQLGNSSLSRPIPTKSGKLWNTCSLIIGLDQWLMVVKETLGLLPINGTSGSEKPFISTNYGVRKNLIDFFFTSDISAPMWQRFIYEPSSLKALLNNTEIDYSKLYSLPDICNIETTEDRV